MDIWLGDFKLQILSCGNKFKATGLFVILEPLVQRPKPTYPHETTWYLFLFISPVEAMAAIRHSIIAHVK